MIGLFLHLSFISHLLSSNTISAFHFILSLTYVEEITGELSSDSESDESVEEVFPLGQQRQPPPQQEPRHQREERPSSPHQQEERPPSRQQEERPSSSMSNRSSTPRRRVALGPFVHTNNGRTGIRSANHEAGLIGILQLAGAHETGLISTLGHNNRLAWFQDNITVLFQADGPLGMFKVVSPLVLLRHFAVAQGQAKDMFDRSHSADQTGAAQEDVPPWAQHFFRYFEALQNVPSASAQAAELRSERRSVVAGLMGRQAPLGNHPGRRPVPLRTETSPNFGSPRMRQRNMGNFNVEVVGDATMNERISEEEFLVEGVDDAMEERPARRRRINSGVRRRNANIDFGAGRNDPAARFQHVTSAFSSLDALTNAVAQSFSAQPAVAPRTVMDVVRDFAAATDMLVQARERNDTVAVSFYETIRQHFIDEQARFAL